MFCCVGDRNDKCSREFATKWYLYLVNLVIFDHFLTCISAKHRSNARKKYAIHVQLKTTEQSTSSIGYLVDSLCNCYHAMAYSVLIDYTYIHTCLCN